jgi:hypothetical protein
MACAGLDVGFKVIGTIADLSANENEFQASVTQAGEGLLRHLQEAGGFGGEEKGLERHDMLTSE